MGKRSRYWARYVLALAVVIGVFWHLALAHASFNANNIIDDGIFDNSGSMTASQIDSWINTNFPNSCISTDNGFTSPEPTGYTPTSGFTYSGNVSAGNVIYDAAHVYGLNPQVIIATLEKESSVVTGDASYHCQYINTAMGFDCPDAGSCPQYPATESGFSKQVINAAWMLKFHEQRSKGNIGWDVQVTDFPHLGDKWDNSDDPQSCYSGRMTQGTFAICPSGASSYYDGYTTIDSTTVHLDDGATAALYDYTPHFSGNEHFDNIFLGWFGSIYAAPYATGYVTQSAYPQLNTGQQTTVYIEYQNLGENTWYDDQSISSAPSGSYPIHLATDDPLNRSSIFSSGWPSNNRAANVFSAVYLSDGSTLASNQHEALPGQIIKFSFTITVPSNQLAGIYQEYFTPVAEGSPSGGFNDPWTFLNVTVNAQPALTYVSESSYPTIAPTMKSNAYIMLSNSGNTPLYDDQSIGTAPSGNYPVHFATANPINSASSFSADWPSASRAAYNFAAVYNSDGTTLAPNQHIAQPGQIIKFSFNFTVPPQYTNGTYNQYMQPILEGTPTGYFPGMGIFWTITVPQTPVINVTSAPSASLTVNQPGTLSVTVSNVGNSATDSAAVLTSTSSQYQAPSWISGSQVVSLPSAGIAAGQNATISVPVLAPGSTSNSVFNCGFSDNGSALPQTNSCQVPVTLSPATYTTSYVSQSSYPTLTYGQSSNAYLEYQNTGNQPWYDDSSISGASWRNPSLVHLATSHSLNRNSGFAVNWPSPNRAATTFAAVYNSDGTTLATNQHEALPGQIAKFSFSVSPYSWVGAGVTREFFSPVVEGSADGLINDPWTFQDVTVLPYTYASTYSTESSPTSLSPGQQATVFLTYKNNGNGTWYDDSSLSTAPASAGASVFPVHLATSHSLNRNSDFSASWPSPNRAATTFAAVYNSDGYTLSSNQHVVQPGQSAKFSFTISVPANEAPGTYNEYFQPVADGSSNGLFNDPWTFLTVKVN